MAFGVKNSRLIAAGLAVAAAGFAAWIATLCLARPEVYFLQSHSPAQWILYPRPSQCMLLVNSELETKFHREFVLADSPPAARLSIRGLRRWDLAINGQSVASSSSDKNWKEATGLDVSHQLHAGTNEILVTVFSSNSPPVLWLALDAGAAKIVSGADWDSSLMDAVWEKAAIAGVPEQFVSGNPISGAERPLSSLFRRGFILAVFAIFSGALLLRGGTWLEDYRRRGEPAGAINSPKFTALTAAVPALLWAILFYHNHPLLPPRAGYDAINHIEYIEFIRAHWKLPLATDGWQMYQPPLYYLVSAVLLLPFDPGALSTDALVALRCLGWCIGAAQFTLVFLCLRRLFPERLGAQWLGALLAAFLPECIGLSQFATNECFAATLFTAAIYFCLRILNEDGNSWWVHAAFGICLGASLLSKFTGVIGLPFFGLVILSRMLIGKAGHPRVRLAPALLGFAAMLAVCGWHYLRVWRHFGHPLVGNWDPASGYHWWMDNGYHVRAWFFHFGTCLSYPWFSGINGLADGLYSTLWGDGMWSGVVSTVDRPPWNYEMMAAGYLLALVPMALIICGAVIALIRFIRRPDAVWLLLLGVAFATLAALIYMSAKLPAYAQVKAFYGMIALVPMCAFAALGWEFIAKRGQVAVLTIAVLMGVWAMNSYGSYWIRDSDPETHLTLGRYYADHGNPAAGLAEYREAARLAPDNPKVRTRLAVALSRENPAKVNELLEANLAQAPGDAETHSVLALFLGAQKKYDEAIREARKSIELALDQTMAYGPLWKIYMETGRYREAAEVGRAVLRLSAWDAELQRKTGIAFQRAGDLANACVYFAHAVSLRPVWPEGRDQAGTAFLEAGRRGQALEQLTEAVRLNPDDANFHLHLAQALEANGRKSEAISECHHALELDPGLTAASELLKYLNAGSAKR